MDEKVQNKPSCHTTTATEDDSILDFKSPKSKIMRPTTIKQKKKPATKLKHPVKNKGIQIKQQTKKGKSLQGSQSLMESSFFKPKDNSNSREPFTSIPTSTNEKVAFICPLCFKPFKDLNSQALHMKLCAFKNNISTKKLIDAIELQKRQENERKSLGLLVGPVIQDKKKALPRKINSCEDSDIQLAIALSKSLHEAEELNEICETEILCEIPNEIISEASEPISKTQLEQFGFASSKPVSFIKNRKKRFNEVTPLQTRSQDERNRILTERIAEILMGNDAVTQKPKIKSQCNQQMKAETILRSQLLQKLCCKECKLWDKARLTPSRKCFYVANLSEFIIPQEDKTEVKEEETVNFPIICEIKDSKLDKDKMEAGNNEKELCFENERYENCEHKEFTDALVTDWGNALNDSSASDIIIFVNNDRYIWAHKLVFYIRCSNLLLEIVPNDTLLAPKIKEKICWFDIPYNIALGFLEFIYCGIIKKYSDIFKDSESFSSLRSLARRYKVKELFTYLQKKENKIKQTKILQVHDVEETKYQEEIFELNKSKEITEKYLEELIKNKSEFSENILTNTSPLSNTQSPITRNHITEDIEENTTKERLDQTEIDRLTQMNIVRHSNVSPDMFEDDNFSNRTVHIQETGKDEDIDSIKSISLDSVSEVIDTINSSKTVNSSLPKNVEECTNSLSNTPHSSSLRRSNVNDFDVPKLKSNLSLFIEQFQKENAKSDSDVDSEISILSICPNPNRNPFNIKQHESFNEYFNLCENNMLKEQDVLSKFDCSMENRKSNVNVSAEDGDTCSSPGSMGTLSQSIEYNKENSRKKDEKDISEMKIVYDLDKETVNRVTPSTLKNLLKDDMDIDELQSNEDQDNVPSDFEIEENELSMYTRYIKEHQNNSIMKYRDFAIKHVLNNSVKSSPDNNKDEKETNPDGEDVTILSDIDISSEFVTLDEEHIDRVNTSKKQNRSNTLRYSKSEGNIDVETLKNNSLMSSTRSRTNEIESVEHPVLVVTDSLNENRCNENNVYNNISIRKELDDYSHIFENDIYLANVHINDSDEDKSNTFLSVTKRRNESQKRKEETPPTLGTKSCSFTEESSNTEKLLTKRESNRKFQKKSMSETNLSINAKNSRNNVLNYYDTSSTTLCKCGHKKTAGIITSSIIIRDSITPPPNYDGMKSPELHKELNKYGLKIQKRKRAVKLLTYIYDELHPIIRKTPEKLNSEYAVISSEDDEPPAKKINCSTNYIDCIDDYKDELSLSQTSPVSIQSSEKVIDEERQIDDLEPTTLTDNTLNIKDAFLKLIKIKKEIYNKILAYEPLCVDSLHAMLKEKGFKCKMDTLTNFLNEQCITFYCKETRQRKDKKRF
ncbi:uncharacterized protein LOC143185377 [Calliopsis andreniformis]|uniref:uncharacterized protein LOC143185377 n=1 Tax=Calliopsis andreniformis TaxID=337506 RepID=UPI003FCCC322